MNLQLVTLRPGQVIHASCRLCGESTRNSIDGTLYADLDGEAFKAYYHGECAEVVRRKERKQEIRWRHGLA
jgi:hypothetical protein